MPTLDTRFSEGDTITLEGRYVTILGVADRDGTTQYHLSKNGRLRWKDSLPIDRNAKVPEACND